MRTIIIQEKVLSTHRPDVTQNITDLAKSLVRPTYVVMLLVLSATLMLPSSVAWGQVSTYNRNITQAFELLKAARYAEAILYAERAVKIAQSSLPAKDQTYSMTMLGNLYSFRGRYVESEAIYKRAISIGEQSLGPNHPNLANSLENLGTLFNHQGRYEEAEQLWKRALAINEIAYRNSQHMFTATLDNLAGLYATQDRYGDAEALYKRALAIWEKDYGRDSPLVAKDLSRLGNLYRLQRQFEEAEPLLKRAVALHEANFGRTHPNLAEMLTALANLYADQGRYEDAQPLHKRALGIWENSFGAHHQRVAEAFESLASTFDKQGKKKEVEIYFKRALEIYQRGLSASHPSVASTLDGLAQMYAGAGDSRLALDFSRKATTAMVAHAAIEIRAGQATDAGLIVQRVFYFQRHVANLAAAVQKGTESPLMLAREALEIAQRAVHSSAAAAVQQMALRFTSATGLGALVRENQDLSASWRDRDRALIAALSKAEGQQDRAGIDGLRKQIAEIEGKLRAVVARLERQFPDYASLASPKPLTAEEVQKLLSADEALVFFLSGEKESYVFALTHDGFEWRALPIGDKALAEKLTSFRHELDVDELDRSIKVGKPVLFDLGIAQELYATLLGPVEALIKDRRHLLVVPSGPLTALPFHLLVTDKPAVAKPEVKDIAVYRDAAWLIKRHAITVLPSVASLKALRVFARKDQQGSKPLIGFGDPLFKDGPAPSGTQRLAVKRTAAKTRAYSDYWRGREVDRSLLTDADPLPETADELKAVAAKLGASASDIYLGRAASETNVKRATLSNYRVVYFATHGLVAGDVKGLGEPALLLSLPREPSDFDDGLLTASEVAQLKLNADWVVLSACNTMAGDKPGAEALSGLARAFFYAGTRALLVSHWAVDSTAAAWLTTSTFDLLKANPDIGRAEALRRAMLAYMNDTSNPRNAYPAFWGPFSMIGEGANK